MKKTVNIDGLEITYIRKSESSSPLRTLVFLHGWKGSSKSWEANVATLSEVFDCITVDMPGFGISATPDEIWGVAEYARFVKNFTQALKLQKFALIGKSFGGRVALYYASKWPQTLSYLVLVSAAGTETRNLLAKLRIAGARLGKFLVSKISPSSLNYFRSLYYKATKVNKDTSDYKWDVKKLVTNTNLKGIAETIAVPTIVVWGEGDTVLPLATGKKLSKLIDGSQFLTIPGGHDAHKESAEKFNSLIREKIS